MDESRRYRIHHHVQLPGGKHVEVTYLSGIEQPPAPLPKPATAAGVAREAGRAHDEPPAREPATAHPATKASTSAPSEALHVCEHCGGRFVYPLDWIEETPERWRILMRCPECEARREDVFGRAQIERLDDELDRASATLLSDLRLLTHANMSEEVELFKRALELDLIEPHDFRP